MGEPFDTFFNIIAWVFGVPCALLWIAGLIRICTLSELQKLQMRINGFKPRLSPVPLVVAIICFAWIIAT